MQRKIMFVIGGLLWLGFSAFVFYQIPKFQNIYADFDLRPTMLEAVILNHSGVIFVLAAVLSGGVLRLRNKLIPLLIVPIALFVCMGSVLMIRISQLASVLS